MDRISAHHVRRVGEFHSRQLGCVLKERFHRDCDPRSKCPAQAFSLLADRVEGGGSSEVHHDQALAILLVGGDRVDDSVRPYLAGVVNQDRHPGLDPRTDKQGLGPKVPLAHLLQRKLERRNDIGDYQRLDLPRFDCCVQQQLTEEYAVLVIGTPDVCFQSPMARQLASIEDPENHIGVSDVDRQQHRIYSRTANCSRSPASTRSSVPRAVLTKRAPPSSMSSATPCTSSRSPLIRTFFPSVAEICFQASRTGRKPFSAWQRSHSSIRAHIVAANGARNTGLPSACRTDVTRERISSGKSVGSAFKFTPTPTTATWILSCSPESSLRMPATLT